MLAETPLPQLDGSTSHQCTWQLVIMGTVWVCERVALASFWIGLQVWSLKHFKRLRRSLGRQVSGLVWSLFRRIRCFVHAAFNDGTAGSNAAPGPDVWCRDAGTDTLN